MTDDVAGLLLAAGAGLRMGGPKALLRLTPTAPTLVEVAVSRLLAGGCDRVVVVTGAAGERVGHLARSAGARVVYAERWRKGMGESLRAGLGGLVVDGEEAPEAVLVSLVDLPDVDERVVARVVAEGGEGRARLARAAYGDTPGHPVLIGCDWWAEVAVVADGDHGAREFLRERSVRLVECGDLATGRDVDLPSQL